MKYNSALVAEASGSLGGIVASHNRGGPYLRKRSVPTNPNSGLQQAVRSIMTTLAQAWSSTLTAAERDAWATFALNVPVRDSLGATRYLTALQQFCKSNAARMQGGLSMVSDAPSTFVETESGTVSAVATQDSAVLAVTFDNTKSWATGVGGALLIYVSRPQSATINSYKGPYEYAGKIAGALVPPASPANVTMPRVAGAAGTKVFWRAVAVTADGRVASPFRGVSVSE